MSSEYANLLNIYVHLLENVQLILKLPLEYVYYLSFYVHLFSVQVTVDQLTIDQLIELERQSFFLRIIVT